MTKAAEATSEVAVVNTGTAVAIPSRSERAAALAARVKPVSNMIRIADNGTGFNIPGLGETEGPIDIVILDFVAKNVYYDPNTPWDPKKITPPLCAAIGFEVNDALVPFANGNDVQVDEGEGCKDCTMNQWGSKGEGKACQNRKLVAVLPADATADTDIMVLDVSATGIKGFDKIIAQLSTTFGKEPHNFTITISPVQAGKSKAKTFGFSAPKVIEDAAQVAFLDSRIDEASNLLAQPVRFD